MKDQDERPAPQRKPYAPPKLTEYGHVGALTQAGSVSPQETPGAPNATSTTRQRSERHLKTNIVKVGMHPSGAGLYLFEYRPEVRDACGHGRHLGCMADEVEAVRPDAIRRDASGTRWVDYAALGIRLSR